MAACKELVSCSLIRRSSLLTQRSSPFLSGDRSAPCFPTRRQSWSRCSSTEGAGLTVRATATNERSARATVKVMEEKAVTFKVRAAVTVRRRAKEGLKETRANQLDALSDKVGRSVLLELVSTEIDARSKKSKTSRKAVVRDWFEKKDVKSQRVVYTAAFVVDTKFGEPEAITVVNRHQKEFFLESVVVEGFPCSPVHFSCNFWVQPTKPYLPSETPPGLRELRERERELRELRGDGEDERKLTDRVYDYATYNDLGNPDK